jgi:hypothetical protein
MPECHQCGLAPPSKLKGEPPLSRTSLWSPPTPETLVGEFAILHSPRRTIPHQQTGSVATAPLAPVRSAMVPPHQPIRATATL